MESMVDEIKKMNEDFEEPETKESEEEEEKEEEQEMPEEEEEVKEEETPESESKPDKLDLLMEKISNLEKELAKKAEPATKSEPVKEEEVESIDFLSDVDDVYDLVMDKERFNKLLNTVYQQGRKQTSESLLRQLPDIVRHNVQLLVGLQQAAQTFYTENPDLKPHAKTVAEVYEVLASENPDMTVEELFGLLSNKVRERLKLRKKVTEHTPTKPALPPGTKNAARNMKTKPDISAIMAEIEAMNSVED